MAALEFLNSSLSRVTRSSNYTCFYCPLSLGTPELPWQSLPELPIRPGRKLITTGVGDGYLSPGEKPQCTDGHGLGGVVVPLKRFNEDHRRVSSKILS